MLNCVPVVVKGGGGRERAETLAGVLESRPPGKLRPRNSVLSLISFFFFHPSRGGEENLYMADVLCRRKDKEFSETVIHLSYFLSPRRETKREKDGRNASTSNIYPEVEERRWKYFHDRSTDRSTDVLSLYF